MLSLNGTFTQMLYSDSLLYLTYWSLNGLLTLLALFNFKGTPLQLTVQTFKCSADAQAETYKIMHSSTTQIARKHTYIKTQKKAPKQLGICAIIYTCPHVHMNISSCACKDINTHMQMRSKY